VGKIRYNKGMASSRAARIAWVVATLVTLSSGARAAPDPPTAAAIQEKDLAETVLSSLRDGDSVLLVAAGLRHYQSLSASRAKIRVYHLTPGKDPLTEEQFGGWKKALPVPLDCAVFRDGRIRGNAGNAEITVYALPSMDVPPGRCVVVLDPDFFPPLYESEVRGGFITLSLKLYRSLSERKATGFPLYVIEPLSVRMFPLQWTYADRLWAELWTRPDDFRDALPPRWDGRRESEFLAEFGQFEEAAALLDESRKTFPKDGSIDFQLARLSFWEREAPQGIRFLVRAYRIDRRFLRGFGEFAPWLVSKQRSGEAETVYRAGLALEKDDPHLNLGLMRLLLDRAESLAASDPEEAKADLKEVISLPGPDELKRRAQDALAKIGEPPRK